jgi:uncharacterized SAM-binding protein YcdF (DUF218 family)
MLVLLLGLATWLVLVWLHDHRRDRPRRWKWLWFLPPVFLVTMALFVRSDPIAQKIVGRLVMPVGLIWVAMAGTASVVWLRRRTRAAMGWSVLFLAYTASGCPLVSMLLTDRLESSIAPYDLHDGPGFDAVFVLGGGSDEGPTRPELNEQGDRLFLAAILYKTGKASTLVTSGSTMPGWGPKRDLSAETAFMWTQMGVPREAIIELPGSFNTSQEMEAYKDLVAEKGWRRLGIVSSAYHLPRALRLAESHGLTMTAIPADHRSDPLPPFSLALVPHGRAFDTIGLVVWELVGRWVGR